ncbi:MAG: flagellar motor switch protein FliG [Planctomycetota bacterium]|nr:MAG: flagellar motor switch protein FliG [Planctomycetota bacterium]
MEFLSKLLLQTQNHFRGLTTSQRLAGVSCLALIAVALLWMVQWAGSPAMVPLLDQPMTVQELNQIQERLDALDAGYKLVGQTMVVPAENRVRLQAQLAQAGLLPKDTSIGFDKLMQENNFWQSMEENRRLWNVAKGNELARVIREFEDVLNAKVFIDKNDRRTIGPSLVTPKASVFVKLRPGHELDRRRVFALANLVSGAVAGLDMHKVSVTDATTGRSYILPESGEGLTFDDLDIRQKKEQYFAKQIKEQLANISGLLVSVHAELTQDYIKETTEIHGKPALVNERTETVTYDENTPTTESVMAPAASKNIAVDGSAGKSDKSVTETIFDAKQDTTITTRETPRYGIKNLTASVNVPRSYLAHIFKVNNGDKEPNDTDLETLSVGELEKIKRQVMGTLAITDGEDWRVKVDWFHDAVNVVSMNEPPDDVARGDNNVVSLLRNYGGLVGLGALAVIGLLMMLMLVRKVGQTPPLAGNGNNRVQDLDRNNMANPPVDEACPSEELLVGKEVNEQAIYMQQVVRQVVELIEQDPDRAVSILKCWIDTDNHNFVDKEKSQGFIDEGQPEYVGLSKVAVFMLSVGPEAAAQIMQGMDRNIVEDLTRKIASLKTVPVGKRELIVEEFYNTALTGSYAANGGLDYAQSVIEKAMPKDEAKRVIEDLEHQVQQQPFSFLQETDTENLLTFIHEEHPQTIALIVAHLPAGKAGEILAGLPQDKQVDVVTRVSHMEQTHPEVIQEVEKGLQQRLAGVINQKFYKVDGVEAVAEILSRVDRATEKNVLESLETQNPDLVEKVRRLMFDFEDILLISDKGIQALLKEIEHEELAMALKAASDQVKEKIFNNMSQRASTLIKEDMEYMGPVRLSRVEVAQQQIIDVVRRLEDVGELIIEGRGTAADVVV